MRIGRADFEMGNLGRVHQAVLDSIPEEDAVDETELLTAYDKVTEDDKPAFEQVMDNLSHLVIRRRIGQESFYIRKKAWLSSADVARRLGVSIRTVQAWGQQGVLLGRRVGGRLRFGAEAVEEWVRGGRRKAGEGKAPDMVLTKLWDNSRDAEYGQL